nr:SRPBCC family protein [Coralloluteibacterium stylophorae]
MRTRPNPVHPAPEADPPRVEAAAEGGADAFDFEIAAPPERVFAAIGDIKRWREWMPGVDGVEWLSRGMLGVGSRWRIGRVLNGDHVEQAFEVSDWEPGRELGLTMIGRRAGYGPRHYGLKLLRGSEKDTTRMHVELACDDEPLPSPPVLTDDPDRHRMLITSLEALRRYVEGA